jgi:hypothetical protein
MITGPLEDAQVGEPDAGEQPVLVEPPARLPGEGPGGLLVTPGQPEELGQLLDGDARGHLAGGVAPHPVGDAVELLLGEEQEGVLVVGALPSHVGGARYGEAHADSPGVGRH